MPRVDLRDILKHHQSHVLAGLEKSRAIFENAEAKGDASEFEWLDVIETFLPQRYKASSAFVLDADGERSEFIDLVIHDRHFCPLLFEQGGQIFIPAESVYGAFEIKQNLTRGHVMYSAKKAASVRKLRRTSTAFVNSGAHQDARPLFKILTGILAMESDWTPPFGEPFADALTDGAEAHARLDLGCALRHGAFDVAWEEDARPEIDVSAPDVSLMFFLLRLFGRLQKLGTVPAIDLAEYGRSLEA
jgi:hypothetical protein